MTETQTATQTPPVPVDDKPTPPPVPKKNGNKVTTMALKDIELSDEWNREKLGDIKGLVQSIKEKGLKVPLAVRKHPKKESKAILVDGRRRYAALQEAGIKEVTVVFDSSETDLDATEAALLYNSLREDNTAWEKSKVFQRLVEGGRTVKTIARACGQSEGFVSQHLAAQRVHKKLQAALRADKIPLSAVRHFTRLDYEKDTAIYEKFMDALIEGKFSAQDIGDKIDAYVNKRDKTEAKEGKEKGKKEKAEKKRPGPKIHVTDYASPETRKMVKMISKDKTLEWLSYYGEKLKASNSSRKRVHLQGVLEGLEIAAGLIVEE